MEDEMLQYSVDVTPTLTAESMAAAGVVGGMFGLFYVIVLVISIVAMWKVYTKAGRPGWASLIPFYNIYVLLQIVGRPGWWLLLMFVPLVNIVIVAILSVDLAKSFGQSTTFGVVALFLFSLVGYLILAFSNDMKYVGPSAAGGNSLPGDKPESAAPAV